MSGGKSILRSVLNTFSQLGSFFLISNVQDGQCNIGKFEGNSLIGKIVILSRKVIKSWGSAVYLDLVF